MIKDLIVAVQHWQAMANEIAEQQEEIFQLTRALKTSKTRLQICFGRMNACNITSVKEDEPQNHEVSIIEIPFWIEEMEDLLRR